MSDYISKSVLLKNLWDWRLQECPVGVCDEETETYKTICECIKAVEEQPTVDEKEIIRKTVERIVERLEETRDWLMKDFVLANKSEMVKKDALSRINQLDGAIEIVKKVGGLR